MRKLLNCSLVAVVMALVFVYAPRVQASPKHPLHLNWGANVNPHACDAGGPPVVNVNMKIINDADSGEAGNYWAMDSSNKSIQIWDQHDGTYCAVVKYNGKFNAVAGQTSPGNTGVLSGKEDGTFEGGYIATITGTMLAHPAMKTHGNLGVFDYGCDLSGDCPGAFDWVGTYFNYTDFEQPWWGWIYHGDHNWWINAITGNAGDVIR